MSKISLEPNASGAGTFSIVSPDSNTNRTLNLPDASGNIIAADASTGRFDSSNMPAGSVIQVVQGATSTATTTTSTSFSDTGLNASIFPNNANNKILVSISQPFFCSREREFVDLFGLKLFRDSTEIVHISETLGIRAQPGSENGESIFNGVINYSYIDFPSSTSELTYKTQFNIDRTGQNAIVGVNRDGLGDSFLSTITLMEIAG